MAAGAPLVVTLDVNKNAIYAGIGDILSGQTS